MCYSLRPHLNRFYLSRGLPAAVLLFRRFALMCGSAHRHSRVHFLLVPMRGHGKHSAPTPETCVCGGRGVGFAAADLRWLGLWVGAVRVREMHAGSNPRAAACQVQFLLPPAHVQLGTLSRHCLPLHLTTTDGVVGVC